MKQNASNLLHLSPSPSTSTNTYLTLAQVVRYPRLPYNDPKRLRRWLISMKWENWTPTKESKICSKHFTEDCFDRTGQTVRLRPHAVPTIFSFPKHLQKTAASRKTRVALAAGDAALKTNIQPSGDPPQEIGKKSTLPQIEEVSMAPCDHNYATMDSRKSLKHKLDDLTERLQLCKKKLKMEQQNSRRFIRRVTNLSSLITFLQDKKLISSNCADLLEATLSGVPKEIRERVLNRCTQKNSGPYPQELHSFAITLHFYSVKAYNYVRQAFDIALPHPRQVRSWYSDNNGAPGFTKSAFSALKAQAKENKAVGKETLCAVMLDERAICRRVEYVNGCVYGYVDVGQGYLDDSAPVAKDVLVLMAISLNASWKIPLGYFLLDKLNGEEQANLILHCFCRLHSVGVRAVALTCDGPSCHFSMMHHLGVNMNVTDTDHSFFHPADLSQKVYIIFDICYMLKLLRNSFMERGLLWTQNGRAVKWHYLEELDILQKAEGQSLGDLLYNIKIQWRKQKMKVNLAEQVFSANVADSLQYCNEELKLPQFEGCVATVEFIRHVDSAFDILNSCNPLGKGLKAPMNKGNFDRIQGILNSAKQFLLNLKNDAGEHVYMGARKTGFVGFVVSIDSVINLFTKLVGVSNSPLSYLATYKFSQDHLALFFVSVRSRGEFSNPPTAQQFQEVYKFLFKRQSRNYALIANTEIPYAEDITQSTISIARKYDLSTGQLTENEQDYADLPDFEPLSLFKEVAIKCVADRVVEMMTERLHCMQCICSLTALDRSPQFATMEDGGGLVKASASITSVCLETERCFQQVLRNLNSKPLQSLRIPNKIYMDILHRSADMNLFSDLRTHQFETAVEDNHVHKLIRMASSCYIKIRLYHLRNRNMKTMTG